MAIHRLPGPPTVVTPFRGNGTPCIRWRSARSPSTTLAVGMGMLAALVIAEIALRSSGYEPWKEFDGHLEMPRMHEPDPVVRGNETLSALAACSRFRETRNAGPTREPG